MRCEPRSFRIAVCQPPSILLKQVPLFKGLDDKSLKRLSETFIERSFVTGQELTIEGSGGVGFFVIESGEARVTVDGEERRVLGAGDFFGEVALLDAGLRTATVMRRVTARCTG